MYLCYYHNPLLFPHLLSSFFFRPVKQLSIRSSSLTHSFIYLWLDSGSQDIQQNVLTEERYEQTYLFIHLFLFLAS